MNKFLNIKQIQNHYQQKDNVIIYTIRVRSTHLRMYSTKNFEISIYFRHQRTWSPLMQTQNVPTFGLLNVNDVHARG